MNEEVRKLYKHRYLIKNLVIKLREKKITIYLVLNNKRAKNYNHLNYIELISDLFNNDTYLISASVFYHTDLFIDEQNIIKASSLLLVDNEINYLTEQEIKIAWHAKESDCHNLIYVSSKDMVNLIKS